MSEFLRYLYIGLGNGAIYAMLGLGLVVIYRSTGLLNFAQGEMAMFATFIVWMLHDAGLPLWVALLGGMVGGFLIGAIVHQVVVKPVGDPHQKPLAVVIIPLLFETRAEAAFDATICVACSDGSQRERLVRR